MTWEADSSIVLHVPKDQPLPESSLGAEALQPRQPLREHHGSGLPDVMVEHLV